MKKIKFATMAVALASTMLFSSCDKDDDTVDVNSNSSSSLTAGRAGIIFNSNTSFITGNSFNVKNTDRTQASTTISGPNRVINLTAIELTGSNSLDTRSANISIILPSASTTAQGNLISDLSIPTSETRVARVTLNSTTGTTMGTSYTSESGTLTITKLSDTEIEGTFNATVSGGGSSMVISNGSFAGKF